MRLDDPLYRHLQGTVYAMPLNEVLSNVLWAVGWVRFFGDTEGQTHPQAHPKKKNGLVVSS